MYTVLLRDMTEVLYQRETGKSREDVQVTSSIRNSYFGSCRTSQDIIPFDNRDSTVPKTLLSAFRPLRVSPSIGHYHDLQRKLLRLSKINRECVTHEGRARRVLNTLAVVTRQQYSLFTPCASFATNPIKFQA